jgi:hypothetical protein
LTTSEREQQERGGLHRRSVTHLGARCALPRAPACPILAAMSEINPYAAPVDDDGPRDREPRRTKKSRAWREGDRVVVRKDDARLPKRCVVCNVSVRGERQRKQLSWNPPWVTVLIFVGLLFYVIAVAVTRKSAWVEFALCEQHDARRRNGLILLWSGLGGGIGLMILGAIVEEPSLIVLGIGLLVVGIVAGAIMARTLHPTKIDEEYVWLNVGRPFLDSIPYRDED